MLHEHVGTGDADVGELAANIKSVDVLMRNSRRNSHPSVVDTVTTHLLSDVSDGNSRQELEGTVGEYR